MNIGETKVSIYKDIFVKNGDTTITVIQALKRIKEGTRSKDRIEAIRAEQDPEIRSAEKMKLPCVTFSGTFNERFDDQIINHSGLIVLDFDKFKTFPEAVLFKSELAKDQHIYAAWISPSGNGVKALYVVDNGMKHREHFESIKLKYPFVDKSGINPSRVCYESYDPELWVNNNAIPFTKYIETQTSYESSTLNVAVNIADEQTIFNNILKWLEKRNDAFVKGERNLFIFKLASACCRFGIQEETAVHLISAEFLTKDTTFTRNECIKSVQSAYKVNKNKFGSEYFDKTTQETRVISKETKYEIDPKVYEQGYKLIDVIYGEDVREGVEHIFDNGFDTAETTHIPTLDVIRKWKRRQINYIGGIGNAGKSTNEEFLMVVKSLYDGDKWAIFSPENYPSEEWFLSLTEMLMGCDLTPSNPNRPTREKFLEAYSFICKHFFYIYSEQLAPTPQYIKMKFLELIIKEKIDGCLIDPFNMLEADYNKFNGRDDRYIGTVLADFGKFARENNVYFSIIAHPKQMQLAQDGNYPCPNVYDMAGGAMILNRVDNLFMYHRPNNVTDPMNPAAEYFSKKVKKQRLFKLGQTPMHYDFKKKRFLYEGFDPLEGNKYEWKQNIPTHQQSTPF